MKGDAGDGVPNVLSPDNCLVVGERQRPVTRKRLEEWKTSSNMDETVKRNYMRNKAMIDLSTIPANIKEQILTKYNVENTKDRSQLLNYFMKNKLRNLMENLNEF